MPSRAPARARGWQRLTWWFAAAWLPFLAFPLTHVFQADHHREWRYLAGVTILGFAALYLWGFRTYNLWLPISTDHWPRIWVLVGLAVLSAVSVQVLGNHAMGLLPFVVAWASFAMSSVWRWTVGVSCLLALALAGRGDEFDDTLWLLVIALALMLTGYLTSHLLARTRQMGEVERAHLVIAERDRMARDVHDVVGHSLTVVGLKVQLAERLVERDPARARRELTEASDAIKEALAGIRLSVEGVHSSTFPTVVHGAVSSLRDAGLVVDLVGDPASVTSKVSIPLRWVVQELTTNVLRHSHARRVVVEVDDEHFAIEDDGVGTRGVGEGRGLQGVRERLSAAGAELNVTTPDHGGTRMEVTW